MVTFWALTNTAGSKPRASASGITKYWTGMIAAMCSRVGGVPQSLRLPLPLWRRGAPATLRRSDHWTRLARGLNWRWMRAQAGKREKGPPKKKNG